MRAQILAKRPNPKTHTQVQAQNALPGSPKTLLSLHCQGEYAGGPPGAAPTPRRQETLRF